MAPAYATDTAPDQKDPSFERSSFTNQGEVTKDNDGSQPTLRKIKNGLHDMKENVKDVFGRDHPRGEESEKIPQDGKTNPME
ncbi:hypothetical protein BDF20DRAFT_817620 [Mycotypha africana]|uniref:uncharacterized protein n=1 Tax=Mycotypha africana TaxID=64632 RepID=UPI0023001CCD|nr:uncharacterized protein BDF20DRAFT_817620 [Mycotypha africana]KAI8982481.1 hypothetical protein BDF20DRAFT_817620 [Mycotypha africana]